MEDAKFKTVTLDEIQRMKAAGELFHDPNAPEGPELGAEFWAKARIEGPKRTRSVHLKLDPEVFAFFVAETGGKGHLTRMQAVLRAYVEARRKG
jgi:uncharacterized protein (DUF4415 family)